MAIARTDRIKLLFENSNGRLYEVSFAPDTGVGFARLVTVVNSVNVREQTFDNTETTITVDAAKLAAWKAYHNSRRAYAAEYNTAKTLNTVLNAS